SPSGEDAKQFQAVGKGPFSLIELLLKNPRQLDQLIRQPNYQVELLPWFLMISLTAFTLFGVGITLVMSSAAVWPHLYPIEQVISGLNDRPLQFDDGHTVSVLSPWLNGDAFRLIVAYSIGLIAATGICLPSLYFYSLLAGVRMTMLDIVIHALKSKAA